MGLFDPAEKSLFSSPKLYSRPFAPARLYSFRDVTKQLEKRVTKKQISGRYHKCPKKLELDYLISDKVVGTGYNGKVKLATSKRNPDRKFAVKAFNFAGLSPTKKAELESEVELFLGMDHPHITRLTDVYESEEHLDIVMEYMEGGELFEHYRRAKKFSEHDTAEATCQMLLALNYIHSHGVIHGDVKLENFMYDSREQGNLKLIDFGFSKMCGQPTTQILGTVPYLAPEVLRFQSTTQSDQWGLGVIVFALLSGCMPFTGSQKVQMEIISQGKYITKKDRWLAISDEAIDFTQSLLLVDPDLRLTSQNALKHPFIASRFSRPEVDPSIAKALFDFGHQSRFRQCCMSIMAWCLSIEEQSKVEKYFLTMAESQRGAITYDGLKTAMVKELNLSRRDINMTFKVLSRHRDKEIHYSDFLAAMISARIELHEELLRESFQKFDVDNTGYITAKSLRAVLGHRFNGQFVGSMFREIDTSRSGKLSYPEYVSCLSTKPTDGHEDELTPLTGITQRKQRCAIQ